jgi:predicted SprT family Zn-dependent metalloprotease
METMINKLSDFKKSKNRNIISNNTIKDEEIIIKVTEEQKSIKNSILKKIATFSIRSSCPISIFARRRVPIRQTKQTKYSCRRCGL